MNVSVPGTVDGEVKSNGLCFVRNFCFAALSWNNTGQSKSLRSHFPGWNATNPSSFGFFLLFTPRGGDYESVFLGFQKLFMQSRATTQKKNTWKQFGKSKWRLVVNGGRWSVSLAHHTAQEEVKHTHTHNKTEYVVTLAEVDHIWWLATILERRQWWAR